MVDNRTEPTPTGSEAEGGGIGTPPNVRALIAAAVVALVVIGAVTLFFMIVRPIRDEATVELAHEGQPADAPTE